MIDENPPRRPTVLRADTPPAVATSSRFVGSGRGVTIAVLIVFTIVLVASVVMLTVIVHRGFDAARQRTDERAATERVEAQRAVTAEREAAAREAALSRVDSSAPAASLPLGDPATWILPDDYPADALRNDEEGRVAITWIVGAEGLVTDCFVTTSSGHPSLDRAACAAVTRRARYPAVEDGARPRTFRRRVVWQIPR